MAAPSLSTLVQEKAYWNSGAKKLEEKQLAVASPDCKEAARTLHAPALDSRPRPHEQQRVYYETQVPNTKLTICTFQQPVGEVTAHLPKILSEITARKHFCNDYIFNESIRGARCSIGVASAVYNNLSNDEKAHYKERVKEVRRTNVFEFRKFADAVYKAIEEQATM